MDPVMASGAGPAIDPGERKKSSLPSCQLCRQRKIRCDRTSPCSHCQRSGVKCVFPPPARLPRGRQGGRRKADSELLQRIAKLESLVQSLEGDGSSPASKSDSQTSSSEMRITQQRSLPTFASTGARRGSKDSTGSNLDKPFLRTISDEISGLRYVLGPGNSDDDDDDDDDDEFESEEEGREGDDNGISQHIRFAIGGPGWLADQVEVLQYPSLEQQHSLCKAYLANVHTVAKILHGPSLQAYIYRTKKNLECSPGSKGLEALHFAVFHAAATSLSDDECKKKLGQPRHALVRRYRMATEAALAKADFVNSTEISTLQALVLFLQAVRAYDQSRFSWTLISMCVRIAQALGLHRESNYVYLPAFQREMRRRLWWQIAVLDSSMSQDRGTDPVIGPGSYDTITPLHINDADIWLGGPEQVEERDSFTDMTFW